MDRSTGEEPVQIDGTFCDVLKILVRKLWVNTIVNIAEILLKFFEDWGWKLTDDILEPIQTLLPPAPGKRNIIFCNY